MVVEGSEVEVGTRAVRAPLAGVRIYRLIEGVDYNQELRLIDGLIDSLETFWDGDVPALTIVAPNEFVASLSADLFRTPRVAPEVVGLVEVLGSAGDVALAETDQITRDLLVRLSVAGRDPAVAALILSPYVFPIREISAGALLERASPSAPGAAAYGGIKPVGLFHGGAAASAIAQVEGFDQHIVSRRRRLVLDALVGVELSFWTAHGERAVPPLIQTMPEARWRRIAAEGWERQPWKTSDEPQFLHLAGAEGDPEAVLSVVYGALHR